MDAINKRPLMFTNKALVAMTIPVILDSLLSILAGLVDSVMVSSAGEAAVSAISLVDAINLMCITVFSGMAAGGGVIVSQYIGHKDYKQARTASNQLLYVSFVMAVVMTLLLQCFRTPILRLIYGNIEPDVFEKAKIYFFYTVWGYPLQAIGASSNYVLRAMGKNKQASVGVFVFNGCNVLGNAVLIYGFKMGVAGAAIATTVARGAYAVVANWQAHNKKMPAHFENVLKFRLDFDIMQRILRIGSASSLEYGLFYIGRILITSLIATFGTVMITANSVANTLNNIGWVIVGAFGTAMMPVIGQCIGADEKEQAKYYMKKMSVAGTVAMFVLFSAVYLLRNQLVRVYNLEPETLKVCAYYTGIHALFSMGAFYSLAFAPVSGFRAAGDVRYATVLAIATMFIFRVALSYLLNFIFPALGLMCVIIGAAMDWACRSVCNIIRYRSGKWLYKRVI